jgi:phenylalanyl-tRNA synthetase beta chain
LTREQRLRRVVEEVMVGAGFHEAYTWSLVPAAQGRIELDEPYSADMAALRTDLTQGLLESAKRNANAHVESIALFELARVSLPSAEELPHEPWHLGAIADGGFFRAKGLTETLYHALHVEPGFEAGGERVGRTAHGELRELEGRWGYVELDLDALFAQVPDLPRYEDVITFPAVKQDLAFIVDEDVRAGDLVRIAREAAGPQLHDMRVFDVYRGDQVGEGRKSIAFSLAFQSPERTLSDEDAAVLREQIVKALERHFSAHLRA